MKEVKLNALKAAARKSETARHTMQYFAKRGRAARGPNFESELSRVFTEVQAKFKRAVEEDFYQLFRDLDELGVGAVVLGRRGWPTRFKWNYNLRSVGNAGLTGKGSLTPLLTYRPARHTGLEKARRPKVPVKEAPSQEQGLPTPFVPMGDEAMTTMEIIKNGQTVRIRVPLALALKQMGVA